MICVVHRAIYTSARTYQLDTSSKAETSTHRGIIPQRARPRLAPFHPARHQDLAQRAKDGGHDRVHRPRAIARQLGNAGHVPNTGGLHRSVAPA